MAVNVKERGTVGCAYFIAREGKLFCMQDACLGGKETVESLRSYVSPTVLLIPYNLEDEIIDMLEPNETHSRETASAYQLEFRVAGDWKYEGGKSKLMGLQTNEVRHGRQALTVPGEDVDHFDLLDGPDVMAEDGTQRANRWLTLGASIDLDSTISVGCAGAVLGYLHRRRNAAYLPGQSSVEDMSRVRYVESFTLDGSMAMDLDTLLALQVIQAEAHPSSQNRAKGKEGLSLYGLFIHLAKTTQGKTRLRQWFLRPSLSLVTVNDRLSTIGALTRPENLPLTDKLVSHLKKIKNMHITMTHLQKGSSGGITGANRITSPTRVIWQAIRLFIYHSLQIKTTMLEMSGLNGTNVFDKILSCVDDRPLTDIGDLISRTIDDELSLFEQRTVIRQGIDAALDQLKNFNGGMENLLDHVANEMGQAIPMLLNARLNVVYFPQLGFHTVIRRVGNEDRGVYEGPEDDPWQQQFMSDEYVYYKNDKMLEMDECLGDVYGQICDREIEIIQDLTDNILQYEQLLTSISDILGELDCLVALARGATEYNLVRPRMTVENVLDIKGGKHMLQTCTVPDFIANDTHLVGGKALSDHGSSPQRSYLVPRASDEAYDPGASMLMVTGPNYSGKSVYLKQVALIVLLAHVGSFVPAESATIGLTDKILARIWTRESVSKMQSTFMIDLQQTCAALRQATRRSLVIIDEFGKGTESYDGAGLAAGVFHDLLGRGDERPKVVAATHFHEIFENGHLPLQPNLCFMNMQIHIRPMSETNVSTPPPQRNQSSHSSLMGSDHRSSPHTGQKEVVYLYKLVPGRTSSSYGTVCARQNGVPEPVVQHAERLIDLEARGEDLVTACAVLPPDEERDLIAAEKIARAFLAWEPNTVDVNDVRGKLGEILGGTAQA